MSRPGDLVDPVVRGIPAEAMAMLFAGVLTLRSNVLLATIGVSERSFARRKAAPKTRLPVDESERLWRFAEVLGHATRVFGSPGRSRALARSSRDRLGSPQADRSPTHASGNAAGK